MSQFLTLTTQFKDRACLIKALKDMGWKEEMIEIHGIAQHLLGYQGDTRAETAEIIIRRKYVGSMSNDIGFSRNKDGSYGAIISEYDRHKYNEQWVGKLTQRYNYHMVVEQCRKQSLPARVTQRKDGTIRVAIQTAR